MAKIRRLLRSERLQGKRMQEAVVGLKMQYDPAAIPKIITICGDGTTSQYTSFRVMSLLDLLASDSLQRARSYACEFCKNRLNHYLEDAESLVWSLEELYKVCADVLNVKWVVGAGEWAAFPSLDKFVWPRADWLWKVKELYDERDSEWADMFVRTGTAIRWDEVPEYWEALKEFRSKTDLNVDPTSEDWFMTWCWDEWGADYGDIPPWLRKALDEAPDAVDDLMMVQAAIIHKNAPKIGFEPYRKEHWALYPPRGTFKDFDAMVSARQAHTGETVESVREECLFDVWEDHYGETMLRLNVQSRLKAVARSLQEFLQSPVTFDRCASIMRAIELDSKQMIEDALLARYGSKQRAWYEGVPLQIRQKARLLQEKKEGHRSEWECLNFTDMREIIDKNWADVFEPAVREPKRYNKKNIARLFARLKDIRNDLFHPRERQDFDAPYEDLCRDWRTVRGLASQLTKHDGESSETV